MVFIRSALTWHHFYALTLVRLVADFHDFCIGLLELVVKNKTREHDVGMNVHMLSSVCRASYLKKKSSYYSKAGSIVFLSSPEQYLRNFRGVG